MGQDAAAMLPQLHLFHGDCDKVEESIVEKDPDFEVEKSLKQDVDSNMSISIYIYQCQCQYQHISIRHPLEMHSVLSPLWPFYIFFAKSPGSACLVFGALRSRIERGGCQGHPRCPQGHDVSRHVDIFWGDEDGWSAAVLFITSDTESLWTVVWLVLKRHHNEYKMKNWNSLQSELSCKRFLQSIANGDFVAKAHLPCGWRSDEAGMVPTGYVKGMLGSNRKLAKKDFCCSRIQKKICIVDREDRCKDWVGDTLPGSPTSFDHQEVIEFHRTCLYQKKEATFWKQKPLYISRLIEYGLSRPTSRPHRWGVMIHRWSALVREISSGCAMWQYVAMDGN